MMCMHQSQIRRVRKKRGCSSRRRERDKTPEAHGGMDEEGKRKCGLLRYIYIPYIFFNI